jgi:plastocyanin
MPIECGGSTLDLAHELFERGTTTEARRVVWMVFVALFAGIAIGASAKIVRTQARSNSSGGGQTVRMAGLTFRPATLIVGKGSTVTFDNNDVAPHTVTASSGALDSGVIPPGKAFTLVVSEPLSYHCTIHPQMTARLELSG